MLAGVFSCFKSQVSHINIIFCNIPIFILKKDDKILRTCGFDIVYHLENAEMTPELYHDLINFSFDAFWDLNKPKMHHSLWNYSVHNLSAAFLECLKRLVCCYIYLYILCIFII
jgi:hypothetical protein